MKTIVWDVAPVRERGLKFLSIMKTYAPMCRSREGAWIEIQAIWSKSVCQGRRSREGAWIEIKTAYWPKEDVISRSREGAWIEI